RFGSTDGDSPVQTQTGHSLHAIALAVAAAAVCLVTTGPADNWVAPLASRDVGGYFPGPGLSRTGRVRWRLTASRSGGNGRRQSCSPRMADPASSPSASPRSMTSPKGAGRFENDGWSSEGRRQHDGKGEE